MRPPSKSTTPPCATAPRAKGISLSVEDKLKITRLLDELGVHYIEGGWPGSNPKDVGFFERVREHGPEARQGRRLRHAPAAWASTPEDDANIQRAARRRDAGRDHRRQDLDCCT